jgi:hypothetical protein
MNARIIIRAMRLLVILLSLFALGGQTYPPPFPRPNAVKLFENARTQVWDVVWPKGQATPLHRHLYDITGTYYASGDRIITEVDASTRRVSTKAGGIVWQFKGLTHVEEGSSEQPLRAVMIELKGDGPSGIVKETAGVAPLARSATLLDNPRITAWRYVRPAQQTKHGHTLDTVVVWADERTGHAAFVPAGTVHTDEPSGAAASATIFELK